MRGVLILLILALSLALQTTFARYFIGRMTVDLVLVAVVYIALTWGPVAGLVAGTIGGLAQDALSGGVIGIGGLSKTIVGFVTGTVGAQFIVSSAVPRLLMFFGATLLNAACFLGVYALLPDARSAAVPYGQIALQALGNGLLGFIAFQAVESLPGAMQRRRSRRAYRRRA